MHERNIVRGLIESALSDEKVSSLLDEGWKIVRFVVINGSLSPVSSSDLERVFREEGYDVDVIEEEAVVNCECGYNGPPKIVERGHDFVVWTCPSCDRLYPKVISGDRIVLVKAVVERPKV